MSCNLLCWSCGKLIPQDRHNLNAIQRVFCSDICWENFRDDTSDEKEEE